MELQNNISTLNSTLRHAHLQEGFSGPVQNLEVVMVTNVSLTMLWSQPSIQNGIISGYSIYVNNTSVSMSMMFLIVDNQRITTHYLM